MNIPSGSLLVGAARQMVLGRFRRSGRHLLFLYLRHRAAVADGNGVLLAVGAFYAPVFELDGDTGRPLR